MGWFASAALGARERGEEEARAWTCCYALAHAGALASTPSVPTHRTRLDATRLVRPRVPLGDRATGWLRRIAQAGARANCAQRFESDADANACARGASGRHHAAGRDVAGRRRSDA